MKSYFITILILLVLATFLFGKNSYSQNWKYIGFSEMSKDSLFYVFAYNDLKNQSKFGLAIKQKHVFNINQQHPNGTKYSSIEIDRTLNCANKSILSKKLVFKDDTGKVVDTHYSREMSNYKKIAKISSVDYAIYQNYCNKIK